MMATATASPAAGDARGRILRAALQAFAEKGFDGATTRDIAARAGVNLGLIKYYFDGKMKLWRAAVDLAFSSMQEGVDAIDDPSLDERDRFRLLIRGYVYYVARHAEVVRLMHEEGRQRGPRMRWMVDRHVRPMYERTIGLIRGAQARGMLSREIDTVHFFYIMAGAISMIFHQAEECRRLTGVDPTEDAVIEAHADALVHLLLGRSETA